jgi:hypothetical protein
MIWATQDLPVVVRVPATMGLSSNIGSLPCALANSLTASPRLRMLFKHCVRRAASLALCTAGDTSEIKTAMIEITTSSSISVNPFRRLAQKDR